MNWMEFVVSMTGHMAWPAVTVFGLALLRINVGGLIDRLRRAKIPAGEFEFERGLLKFDAAGSRSSENSSANEPSPSNQQMTEPDAPNILDQKDADFVSFAEVVSAAYMNLVQVLYGMASPLPNQEAAKRIDLRDRQVGTASTLSLLLNDQGVLCPDDLLRIRGLDEMAAVALEHPKTITRVRAVEYLKRLLAVSRSLSATFPKASGDEGQ